MLSLMWKMMRSRGGSKNAMLDTMLSLHDAKLFNLDDRVPPPEYADRRNTFTSTIPDDQLSVGNMTYEQRIRTMPTMFRLMQQMNASARYYHGFIYNGDVFAELGLEEPKTEAEFFAVLEAIKADGSVAPMDMGTKDQWESATMGFQNIGPNYWNGETGRAALISGDAKITDPEYVAVWEALAKWEPYLASGFQAQSYPDSQIPALSRASSRRRRRPSFEPTRGHATSACRPN